MVAEGDSSGAWPTVPGGLASPRGWRELETLLADLLTALCTAGEPSDGDGLSLSYLPFTDFGRASGHDLSWEVVLARRGPRGTSIGLGGHPVDAVLDLHASVLPGDDLPLPSIHPGAGLDLQRRWEGWSGDLRHLAEVAATGPASPDEPSPAGFDLVVRWRSPGPAPGWVWMVAGGEVLDESGDAVGSYQWAAPAPAEALRAALADVDRWCQPHST